MTVFAIAFCNDEDELTVELQEAEDILSALLKDVRTKDYFGEMSEQQLTMLRNDEDAIKDLFYNQNCNVAWLEL